MEHVLKWAHSYTFAENVSPGAHMLYFYEEVVNKLRVSFQWSRSSESGIKEGLFRRSLRKDCVGIALAVSGLLLAVN